jgi:hypothetical protein
MKGSLILSLFLILALSLFSWSGHDAITYFALKDIIDNLRTEVQITDYSYEHLDPGPYNPAVTFDDYLGSVIVPEEDRGIFLPLYENRPPVDDKAPAWQVLVVYSYEPDMGMDQQLDLSPFQFLGGGSQGMRHMDFRFAFLRIGEATNRVEHFTQLSRIAWNSGDPYWGLRFMARSLHYLQDIGQPFHTFPAPAIELTRFIFRPSKWMAVFMNYHYFYDFYLGYRLYREYEPFVQAIQNAPPYTLKNAFLAAEAQRSFARKRVADVYYEIRRILRETLEVNYEVYFDVGFFDDLVASGKTEKLDQLTIKIISEVSSYVKGYMNLMSDYLAQLGKEE